MSELERRTGEIMPAGYAELLDALRTRIQAAQTRAALAANRELIHLYWDIGKEIAERQEREGWGSSIIDRLSQDIQAAFPGISGFSTRSLHYMRKLYQSCRNDVILQQLAAELPWGHLMLLIDKIDHREQLCWYAQQALEHGWSRNILAVQIKSDLYARQGKALTNFSATLPPPQSDLAQQVLKDPYLFDFLLLDATARERDLETQLTTHLTRFLLELGAGFAFVGRQIHLEVAEQDFYLDLLFYHTRLHCYVVVELKTGVFCPADAGQLNFYLSAVDAQLRTPPDQPTIGILLCRGKQQLVVEYALRGLTQPIGVADWQTQLVTTLPDDLRPALPTIEEFEAEFQHFPANGGNGDE